MNGVEVASASSDEVRGQEEQAPDWVRVLRRLGVRALVLAGVAALVGMPTVAIAAALAGFGLLFTPVRER